MHYDFIIVGGGTTGCVLANRLLAKSTCQVLLLEAGQERRMAKFPLTSSIAIPARPFSISAFNGLSSSAHRSRLIQQSRE